MSSSRGSSDFSSDSEDEVLTTQGEVPAETETKARLSGPTHHPRHGEKLAFQAPNGYLPTAFSDDLLSSFGLEMLSGKHQKQLWTVKIPEGICPSLLDGMVMQIPLHSSSAILAKLQVTLPHSVIPGQTESRSYSLRSKMTSRKFGEEQTSTQLIAMAGGSNVSSSSVEIEHEGYETLQVLLPHSTKSRPGRYAFASTAPKHQLQLVMDGPAAADLAAEHKFRKPLSQTALTSEIALQGHSRSTKRKRAQPEGLLNGCFSPSGSRGTEIWTQKNSLSSDHAQSQSPFKRRKNKEDSPKKSSGGALKKKMKER